MDAEALFRGISVVTVHEYLRGVYYLYMHDEKLLRSRLRVAEAELARFEVLPYTHEVARTAAEIDATLALQGTSISLADTIVAATTLHYRLTLVTRNLEHFKRVPGLSVETY